jgi:hypothetical protein
MAGLRWCSHPARPAVYRGVFSRCPPDGRRVLEMEELREGRDLLTTSRDWGERCRRWWA